ncbi:hypothetical protein A2866_04730 [Candidatus Roizmanbacteria bacterium RIFCSPHIGHO2_01_FULL_39_8]|uniref:YibE/F family protein n=3 Tax=Candidatus Roizmaniibacteriota TaxID=1752723 RepID=A0A1F7GGT0_9BACT|nr:MAG: hypothetical protein A2866_04730 [Candidatus Roizmanbacteria bacterium RIFCSPHIGHO2_01_FULL_39_8]OGK28505.1 MAG: hypothetical protein A3C28_01910 [Candidatus Roizmanbacteria bacterium RIFCSPHIGHO2_02_FULL_39_9]OGK38179.1 MAG: hypothetical protein A3F60_03030 [Candidatus Roizmanbacteria bacterium RIFCSPHIGHO2_12_FULL_39_8]
MKKVFFLILVVFSLLTKTAFAQENKTEYYQAEVIKAELYRSPQIGQIQKLTVKITQGNLKNKTYNIQVPIVSGDIKNRFEIKEPIIVSYEKLPGGQENVLVVDRVRTSPLLILFFLFLVVVFLIGRLKGFTSFLGMLFTFLIIIQFIVPQILIGNDPVIVSLLAALFIIPVSFILSHGFNKKTFVAIGGTCISLILTGVLAYIFVKMTRLTGYAAEEAVYLQTLKGNAFNIKGLLLAGILIGSMGILDDITISQTSIVEELHKTDKTLSFRKLYQKGMNVGRDHIASLVNTLVLVYAGASLPLFLLFTNSNMNYSMAISNEVIATEIVRTLVSSIGIIAAVPITTLLASYFAKKV